MTRPRCRPWSSQLRAAAAETDAGVSGASAHPQAVEASSACTTGSPPRPACTLVEPLGYVQFMSLVTDAALAITDSGGLQEETTYLGIPCLTVRPNTERPITVSEGTQPTGEAGRSAGQYPRSIGGALANRPPPGAVGWEDRGPLRGQPALQNRGRVTAAAKE